jgi:hypothetical protein
MWSCKGMRHQKKWDDELIGPPWLPDRERVVSFPVRLRKVNFSRMKCNICFEIGEVSQNYSSGDIEGFRDLSLWMQVMLLIPSVVRTMCVKWWSAWMTSFQSDGRSWLFAFRQLAQFHIGRSQSIQSETLRLTEDSSGSWYTALELKPISLPVPQLFDRCLQMVVRPRCYHCGVIPIGQSPWNPDWGGGLSVVARELSCPAIGLVHAPETMIGISDPHKWHAHVVADH